MIFKDVEGPRNKQDRLTRLRRFLPPTEAERLLHQDRISRAAADGELKMAESDYEKTQRFARELEGVLDGLSYRQSRVFLRKQKFPRFLFKFRQLETPNDFERLRSIVVRSELWLSSPRAFNDPFDMGAKFLVDATARQLRERFRKALKDRGLKPKMIERELRKFMARSAEQNVAQAHISHRATVDEMGVCSFGGDPRSILMWSHYAFYHRGVCLAFEIAKDPKRFCNAYPVEYSSKYPFVNWVTEFKEKGATLKIVMRKYIGWKYEDESRIVLLEQANQPLEFRPEALRAIIIGCSMADDTLKSIKGLLTERALNLLPKIHLYRCEMHASEYKLRITSVRHVLQ